MINGNSSIRTEVFSSIPQVSIFDHLLFTTYITVLLGIVRKVYKLCKFANDSTLYHNIASEANQKDLQEEIKRLCQWSNDWLLGLNIKKCIVFLTVTYILVGNIK